MKHLVAIMTVMTFSFCGFADEIIGPEKVSVALTDAYIPGGFDSNDRAELVIEGYFPNTCYRVGPVDQKVNPATGEIEIFQAAYKYSGTCLMMLVPFSQTVKVGILQAKTYTVKDSAKGKELGALQVKETKSSNPDDHMYANVSDAYLNIENGDREIVLHGQLPGNCWKIQEIRALQDGANVIAVLPIIEKLKQESCDDANVQFVTSVSLPQVSTGRYLIHVRSQNGVAVNKLVNL